jgi:DNA (cytosine-5)-methyltransferase 1
MATNHGQANDEVDAKRLIVMAHGQANAEVAVDQCPTLTLLHEVPILAGAPMAFSAKDHGADAGEVAPTLLAGGHTGSHANGGVMPAVAFMEGQQGDLYEGDITNSLTKGGGKPGQGYQTVRNGMQVRRLTPRECERLQGFPDDYTLIPWRKGLSSDGPRYKVLGNSMAVPVMRWIGQRIAMVDKLSKE